jgi:protein-disulfide isomerase
MEPNEKLSMQFSAKQIFLAGVATGVIIMLALGGILMASKGGDMSSWFTGSARVGTPAAVAPTTDTTTPPAAPDQVGTVTPVNAQDHIRGDNNAPVTIIEYSDFQCPFCSRFHPTLVQLMKDYAGKIRWVYRHFPLTSIHPYAEKAAEASECANEQGKFWEMADTYFATQDTWAQSAAGLDAKTLEGLAKQAGVKDLQKFDTCAASGKYAALVAADEKTGEAAGVTGTPGSIILGVKGSKQLVPGALPIESVKQMIDSALQN